MRKFVVSLLILCSPLFVWAASSVPTITKSFKQTPLAEVVQKLEKKTKYTIAYDENEVDGNKMVTASFKQTRLNSVVKRIFGKGYDVKVQAKTKTITVSKKVVAQPSQSAQPVQLVQPVESPQAITTTMAATDEQRQQNIDSIRQTVKIETHSRIDSVMTVTERKAKQPAAEQPDPKYLHCSHRIIAGLGVGYGEVVKYGSVAGLGDVNYAFFFTENWGVSLGLGVDYYQSMRTYNDDYTIKGYQDTDTEPQADLQVSDRNMREWYHLLTINVPVQVQMEYPLPSTTKPMWLYGSVGPRFGYPAVHTHRLKGDRTQVGYYEKWDLTLKNMHEYGARSVDEQSSFPVQKLTIAPHAELGVAIGVRENLAIGVGAYGNVSVWNEPDYLPWQVGAKVSVRWRKNVKPQPLPTVYETIVVKDTTWTYKQIVDTIRTIQYDTIMHPAAQAIQKVMERSIIWFDLDKTIPKLDPIDMLDEIADILIENPDQQIEVNGHTCDLGKKAYNEKLSLRRAQAVVKLLVEKGVRPEQMIVHAYANSQPYYSKIHDRYLDRRVEIVPVISDNK